MTLEGVRTTYTDESWRRLGAAIARRRAQMGITQSQLANLAELNVNSVGHIESGGHARMTNLHRYDHALGWVEGSCVAILEGGEPTMASPPGPVGLDQNEAEMIERIMRDELLTVDQKLEMIEMYRRHVARRRDCG